MLSVNWALHNTLKGWTLYDLTVEHVQLLVCSMSVNEVRLAKVCQKNCKTWSSLTEAKYPDFFIKRSVNSSEYPEIEFNERGTETSFTDTEYFVISPKKPLQLPRLHVRYDIAVKCSIHSSRNSFSTETIDISEGGLHFKELLPDWIAGYFIVSLFTPKAVYQLMCSLVEDQKEKKRVQVVSEESDPQYMLYKEWLLTQKS